MAPPEDLPTTVDELTAEWLTAALRDRGSIDPGTSVLAVRSEPIAEGVGFLSYLHRLHLTFDGAGPATLVAKLPTDTPYLQLAQATGAYDREVEFYAQVAPQAPLRAPRAHVARRAPQSTSFVLLLDDLGHLAGADHVIGLTVDQAGRVLDELAPFHAWGWDLQPPATRSTTFPAVDDPVTVGLYTMGIAAGWATYEANGRVAPPDGLPAFVERYAETLPALLEAVAQPATLVNGDLRADNLFFDDAGRPTTVDFQLVMKAAGIWDVAYLVGQGLTPTERAGRERELVQRYVDALRAAGVADYPFERAWQQFRIATAVQVTFPLTAMLSWETLNDRARELVLVLAERAFAIIEDTDALAAGSAPA